MSNKPIQSNYMLFYPHLTINFSIFLCKSSLIFTQNSVLSPCQNRQTSQPGEAVLQSDL
jgi:hypothetical protein